MLVSLQRVELEAEKQRLTFPASALSCSELFLGHTSRDTLERMPLQTASQLQRPFSTRQLPSTSLGSGRDAGALGHPQGSTLDTTRAEKRLGASGQATEPGSTSAMRVPVAIDQEPSDEIAEVRLSGWSKVSISLLQLPAGS